MEGLSNLTVKFQLKFVLLCDFTIPLLNLVRDPFLKRLLCNSVDYIDQPLSRHPSKVRAIRQIVPDVLVLLRLVYDSIHRESFVVGDMQVAYVVTLNIC